METGSALTTQATGYWHWFFLIQPSPFTVRPFASPTQRCTGQKALGRRAVPPPTSISSVFRPLLRRCDSSRRARNAVGLSSWQENVILADPDAYWRLHTSKASHQYSPWTEEDVKVYQRDYFKPEAVHAVSTHEIQNGQPSLADPITPFVHTSPPPLSLSPPALFQPFHPLGLRRLPCSIHDRPGARPGIARRGHEAHGAIGVRAMGAKGDDSQNGQGARASCYLGRVRRAKRFHRGCWSGLWALYTRRTAGGVVEADPAFLGLTTLL